MNYNYRMNTLKLPRKLKKQMPKMLIGMDGFVNWNNKRYTKSMYRLIPILNKQRENFKVGAVAYMNYIP